MDLAAKEAGLDLIVNMSQLPPNSVRCFSTNCSTVIGGRPPISWT